ncbi:MAG: hypothetical protein OXG46_10885 [Chloroflexi bacterium]|nr:hypothetical protein [Chloroflexota bacterium]MCY3939287.1 hypothetical protein [Chloroflexota bacterium]
MSLPGSASLSRVLIVEGQDDEHVVQRICERCAPSPSFHVERRDGIHRLLDDLGADILLPGRQSVGIVVDANDNVSARWAALRSRLAEEDVDIPDSPEASGIIVTGGKGRPDVGVWLMPDNSSVGQLEDFVVTMIPADDPVWPLAQRYIEGIPAPAFSAGKTLRAQLYAWLAARERPRHMGLAIRAGDLDVDGDLCQKFVDWLTRLFQ